VFGDRGTFFVPAKKVEPARRAFTFMQQTIILNGTSIDYTLKRSARSRRMRLAIHRGGLLVVTIPTRMSERMMERFLLEKADWVLAKIEMMKKKMPIEVVPMSKIELKRMKVVALELVHRRLEYFNDYYRLTYYNVAIRNQKTRWGSCSRQGNLNFNVKIAILPAKLADYIIVHELCHLKEMNHSERFWKLVAQTFPDHKELRKELRKGHSAA
jgi:predicted metal-dependent hydrolase